LDIGNVLPNERFACRGIFILELGIERLKADKEPKFTVCDKEFQTLMTLSVKNLLRTPQLNALNNL